MTYAELVQLREKMQAKAAEARAELDKVKDDTPESQAKEYEARFDAAMIEYDKMDAKAKRGEALLAAESRKDLDSSKLYDDKSADEPSARDLDYKEVFTKMVRHGVSELDLEERKLLQRGRNYDAEQRAQAVGTNSAGGFTVPEGFSGELDKSLAAWGPMLDESVIRVMRTATGNPIPWPTVDTTGNRHELKAENAAASDDGGQDITFGNKTLNSYMYDSEVVRIPLELLQDSFFDMQLLLEEVFGESLARTANDVLTTADGSSKPQGWVPAAGAGITAVGTTAITSDELIDMYHSVNRAYRRSAKCRWQFNDNTLKAIRKLKDGDGNYLWTMGDVKTGAPGMLLDRPYEINDSMADMATGTKPIGFGDFGRYIVRRVGDYTIVTMNEKYINQLQIGMIGFMRLDGELLNSNAVKVVTMA